jgi:hypothetical protein
MMRRLRLLGVALALAACGSDEVGPSDTVSAVDGADASDQPGSDVTGGGSDTTGVNSDALDAPAEDTTSGPVTADTTQGLTDGGGGTADAALSDGGGAPPEPPEGSDCLPNDAFFETALWAPIFSITCVGCHNPSGLAQASELVFDISDTPEGLAFNMAVAEQIALKTLQGVPVLLLKPSNQHPQGHAGGEVVSVGSPQYAALQSWVTRVNSDEDPCLDAEGSPEVCETTSPGPPMLRLMNRAEYDRTIEALFGFPSTWGAAFTPENVLNGFDNQAEVLVVPPLLAEQLRDAAEAIAAQALTEPQALLPCDPSQGDATCRDAFITGFGARVFRRPLTEPEVNRYTALFDLTADEEGFSGAVELVITALLQSPSFLYRHELGVAQADGSYTLTPHEVASFLSYFLWGAMPDAELFARADDGTLTTPEVLAGEVDRLLADDRSAFSIERFTRQWLDIERLPSVPKDQLTYPEFTGVERESMGHQAVTLVHEVIGDEAGTLSQLLTGQEVYVDDPLAAFYGLPAPEGPLDDWGFGPVDATETPYGGLLADGGLLTTHAFSNGSSPIHRGKFVREQLLCQHLPLPPPGIVAEPPGMDPNATTRERFTAHSEMEECAGCHRLIDPIGFAFEHFDGVGRYRAEENGLPIDVSGEIVGTAYTNGTFEGTDELAELLAESPDVQRCFTQQWLRYAYGMEVSASMSCMLDALSEGFAEDGQRVRGLLRAVATSVHATTRMDAPIVVLEPEPPVVVEADAGGTSDDASGAPDAQVEPDAGPEPDPMLSVVVTHDSQWGAGFCDSVTVTNEGATSTTWSVSLEVGGVVTQVWEATYAVAGGGAVVFQGATWNHTLEPGASTSFGFCADVTISEVTEPGDEPGPGGPTSEGLDFSVEIYTDWGGGYCANGAVANVGDAPTSWGFFWPADGEIYTVWEANAMAMGDEIYFTGVASNATLAAGESTTFGFCANR